MQVLALDSIYPHEFIILIDFNNTLAGNLLRSGNAPSGTVDSRRISVLRSEEYARI
jgi:hypothetical protein